MATKFATDWTDWIGILSTYPTLGVLYVEIFYVEEGEKMASYDMKWEYLYV